jgi:hypothetical protein
VHFSGCYAHKCPYERILHYLLNWVFSLPFKITSPMTTTIRIPPYSKCGTILLTFFTDKNLGLEKNGGGIIIFGQSMN